MANDKYTTAQLKATKTTTKKRVALGLFTMPDNAMILEDIQAYVQHWFKLLCVDVALLRQDLRTTIDRVTGAKDHISELEGCVATLKAEIVHLSTTSWTLEHQAEEAENHI
ncbi:hypothetical protein NDU88_003605 [Pleurodeles waltl]|uniref:Uncharacterized protein n=1 Tax=Pleurodeles waltl TaxID=8319 RepID=A0AAV7NHE5_PLEWA|nr:hypothetical protein NDU88_003605 [Pleurodeles waltl]